MKKLVRIKKNIPPFQPKVELNEIPKDAGFAKEFRKQLISILRSHHENATDLTFQGGERWAQDTADAIQIKYIPYMSFREFYEIADKWSFVDDDGFVWRVVQEDRMDWIGARGIHSGGRKANNFRFVFELTGMMLTCKKCGRGFNVQKELMLFDFEKSKPTVKCSKCGKFYNVEMQNERTQRHFRVMSDRITYAKKTTLQRMYLCQYTQ